MADQEEQQGHKEQPIIIKKKRGGGHGGHHGGAWKVAYADFVTAMMAFFIVMWILAQSPKTRESVVAYFKDPGAFNFMTGKRTVPIDLGRPPDPGKGKEGDGGEKKVEDVFFTFSDKKDSTFNKSPEKVRQRAIEDSAKAYAKVIKSGADIKKMIMEQLNSRPDIKDILSAIKIEMTKEGLRIELIESQESLFFEVGSARINPKAKEVLVQLAREIGKLSNSVEIEGHTDSRQYGKNAAYTNWNLSTDRANAARVVLENSGLWDGQTTRVTGFADRKLRNPDNPFDISNRRISILVRHLSAKDLIPDNLNQETEQNK